MARCAELETALAELRGAYEQYFLGNERHAPTKAHERFKKDFAKIQAQSVRQTAAKFRIETLGQKLMTYERLWMRTLKEIETGTYRRDIAKLRRKPGSTQVATTTSRAAEPDFDIDEEADSAPHYQPKKSPAPQMKPPVRPSPAASVLPATPAVPKVAPPNGTPAVSEAKLKAVYDAYVMAKKRCGEDTRALTFDAVANSLKKQVPQLLKQHNATGVDFKVVIKEGKAVLRVLPKSDI